jgi:hypothetical protein
MTNGVFSEYELREMAVKFKSAEEYVAANCVGSCEEELDVKVITKMCRGVVFKKTVKGAGTGKLSISMHLPWAVFTQAYGMELESLKEGVKAYGEHSRHEGFAITQHVFDEDGEEKFKAYPNCIIETGVSRKIENGAEEVAEVELEVSLQPDEFGHCVYEALASELDDETLKTNWMTKFEPSMVQVASA